VAVSVAGDWTETSVIRNTFYDLWFLALIIVRQSRFRNATPIEDCHFWKVISCFMFGLVLCSILDSHTGTRCRSPFSILAHLNSILSRNHTYSRLANFNFMIIKCLPLEFVPRGRIQEENNSSIGISPNRFHHRIRRPRKRPCGW
jgi:hypothetical protein